MKLEEARPKLMKFNIKRNKSKWTVKDVENNKNYYIKINQANAEYKLNNFLQSVNAKDDVAKKSKNPVDFGNLITTLMKGNNIDVWIPSNKIVDVKKTYFTEDFITMKEYLELS